MGSLQQIGRTVAGGCVGVVGGLAAFGLLLGMAWQFPFGDDVQYKTMTVLLAAAAGFTLGGYIVGLLGRRRRMLYGAAFGMLFGLIAFGYVFGPRWQVLPGVPAAGALGGLGGRLSDRQVVS